MFDEFEKEDDNWRPEQPKAIKILKKIPGILFTALALSVIAFLVIRLMLSKPPSEMKEMIWTNNFDTAYQAADGDIDVKQILCSDSFSDDGMFSVSAITYCEPARELQLTVRYNDRVLNYLYADYPDAESKNEEPYTFTLRDDHGNYFDKYEYTSKSRTGYTYRHLIFENITLTDISALYLDVYYSGDYDTAKEPRHTMYVYRYDFAMPDYDIKNAIGKK